MQTLKPTFLLISSLHPIPARSPVLFFDPVSSPLNRVQFDLTVADERRESLSERVILTKETRAGVVQRK